MFNFKFAMISLGTVLLSSSLYATTATMGENIDDAAITTKVKASLLADSDISSLGISVETHKAVVTLTGCTDTKAQMDKSKLDAKKVNGVKSVVSKLTMCKKH